MSVGAETIPAKALETVPCETKGLLLSDRGFIFAETHEWDNDGLSTEYGQVLID